MSTMATNMFTSICEAAAGLLGFARRQLNKVVSPERRRQTYSQATDFATANPLFSVFLVIQVIFAFVPILVFISFAIATILFATSAAILFALFWIGVALVVLLPILCLMFSVALCVGIWASASFAAGRSALGTVRGLLADSTIPPRQVEGSTTPQTSSGTSSTPSSSTKEH